MYQQCSLHAPSRVYIEFVETMSGLRNHSFASGGLLNPGRTLFCEYLYKGWTNYQRNCCYVCTSKTTQISVVNDSQLITQEEMYCSLPTELYNFWVCYQSVVWPNNDKTKCAHNTAILEGKPPLFSLSVWTAAFGLLFCRFLNRRQFNWKSLNNISVPIHGKVVLLSIDDSMALIVAVAGVCSVCGWWELEHYL